jgi:hypothetical protein
MVTVGGICARATTAPLIAAIIAVTTARPRAHRRKLPPELRKILQPNTRVLATAKTASSLNKRVLIETVS